MKHLYQGLTLIYEGSIVNDYLGNKICRLSCEVGSSLIEPARVVWGENLPPPPPHDNLEKLDAKSCHLNNFRCTQMFIFCLEKNDFFLQK